MNLQEMLEEFFGCSLDEIDKDIITIDGFDDAVIGISENHQLIYGFDEMVEVLVNRDGMTHDEAVEFIDYNTIGSMVAMDPDIKPIIMYKLK